jgi:hypothetical protein
MLDFTKSPYVAAFFAMEDALCESAIWAVSRRALDQVAENASSQEYESRQVAQNYILTDGGELGILCVEPFRLNERMAVQQGVFLLQRSLRTTFLDNLLPSIGYSREWARNAVGTTIPELPPLDDVHLVKVILHNAQYSEGLLDLARMNVTSASLFPGLDGLARSLKGALWEFADKSVAPAG